MSIQVARQQKFRLKILHFSHKIDFFCVEQPTSLLLSLFQHRQKITQPTYKNRFDLFRARQNKNNVEPLFHCTLIRNSETKKNWGERQKPQNEFCCCLLLKIENYRQNAKSKQILRSTNRIKKTIQVCSVLLGLGMRVLILIAKLLIWRECRKWVATVVEWNVYANKKAHLCALFRSLSLFFGLCVDDSALVFCYVVFILAVIVSLWLYWKFNSLAKHKLGFWCYLGVGFTWTGMDFYAINAEIPIR